MIIACCIRLPLLPNAVSQRIIVLFGKYDDLQVTDSLIQLKYDVSVLLRRTCMQYFQEINSFGWYIDTTNNS